MQGREERGATSKTPPRELLFRDAGVLTSRHSPESAALTKLCDMIRLEAQGDCATNVSTWISSPEPWSTGSNGAFGNGFCL